MTEMEHGGFDDPEYEARYQAAEAETVSGAAEGKTEDDWYSTAPDEPDEGIAAAFAEAFCGAEDYRRLRLTTYGRPGTARDFECGCTGATQRHAVDLHWAEICTAQAAGNGVFFYLNQVREGAGRGYNGVATNGDVENLLTLSVDFDGGLPDWYHVEPDIVIKTSVRVLPSGGKVQRGQALWLIAETCEPYQQAGMASRFKRAQLSLAAYYGEAADHSICDLRRVHRLPGSMHTKDPDNPQLVTFERQYTGLRRQLGVIIEGLPEVIGEAGVKSEKPAIDHIGPTQHPPIAEIVLRETLSYIDPPSDEPTWRRLVAAIKATPLLDGDGEEVAVDWSAGRLDRKGRYAGSPPANWDGDEIVRDKYRRAQQDRPGGKVATFGSLVWEAWEAGMPRDSRIRSGWIEHAAARGQAGPFLLRTSDLFGWPDPQPLVHDFLMQGEDACLYSPPKCGKTFVALDTSLSLAAGLPVLGQLHVLRPGEAVVYLSGEGHAGMKKRIRGWFQQRGLAPDTEIPFFYKTDVPATKEGSAAALRYIAGIRQFCSPVLIVIDTMSRSLGGDDENTAAAANAYLNMLSEIRSAFGCTTLTLAHAGKESGRGIRGSSAFTGGFDAIWFLEANKENRTAKLEALWLKDADELGPHCFRMETVYIQGMGSGAVLRYLPMAEYKTPAEKGMAATILRARIAQLLTENKVTAASEWTHKVVTEKLLPTPRPDRNEVGNNEYLEWETAYKELYKEVGNAARGAEVKRMGAKKVLHVGGGLTWVWFSPGAN